MKAAPAVPVSAGQRAAVPAQRVAVAAQRVAVAAQRAAVAAQRVAVTAQRAAVARQALLAMARCLAVAPLLRSAAAAWSEPGQWCLRASWSADN